MTWAEDEEVRQRDLRRAQASLRRRSSSLQDSRDYYEKKADDISLPRKERDQWQALADEMSARLGDRRDDSGEQPGLF